MIYVFKHPKKEEYVEVYQDIHAKHEYSDKRGLKWERVFTAPNIGIDTKQDPFSQKQFLEKTRLSNGKVGDLLDRSLELSEKRASKNGGVDPVREKFFKDYAKNRRNKKHPSDPKRYAKLKKMGVGVEFK